MDLMMIWEENHLKLDQKLHTNINNSLKVLENQDFQHFYEYFNRKSDIYKLNFFIIVIFSFQNL